MLGLGDVQYQRDDQDLSSRLQSEPKTQLSGEVQLTETQAHKKLGDLLACETDKVKRKHERQSIVVHACNPSTWAAKAERLQIQGKPGLHSETQPHKTKPKKVPKFHPRET
jgi:hypothetical protein